VTTLTTTTAAAAAFPGGGDGVPPMATMETLIDSIDRSNNVLSMILRGLFAKVADQERALQAERAQRQKLEEMIAQGGLGGGGDVRWEDLELRLSEATGHILSLVQGVNGTLKTRVDGLEQKVGNLVYNLQGFEMEMHSQTEAQREAELAFERTMNEKLQQVENHERQFERDMRRHSASMAQASQESAAAAAEAAAAAAAAATNRPALEPEEVGHVPTHVRAPAPPSERRSAAADSKTEEKSDAAGAPPSTSTQQLAQQGYQQQVQVPAVNAASSSRTTARSSRPASATSSRHSSSSSRPASATSSRHSSSRPTSANSSPAPETKTSQWSKLQVAAKYITKPVDHEEVKKYRDYFRLFDADASGKLEVDEVLGLMKALGLVDMSRVEVLRMMGESDADASGEIDENEFIAMMTKGSWAHKFRNAKLNMTNQRVGDPKRSIGSRVQEIEEFMHRAGAQFRRSDKIVLDLESAMKQIKSAEKVAKDLEVLRASSEAQLAEATSRAAQQDEVIEELRAALALKPDLEAIEALMKSGSDRDKALMENVQLAVLKELSKLLTSKEEKAVVAEALERVEKLEDYKREKVDQAIGETLPDMAKQLEELRESVKSAIEDALGQKLKTVVQRPELDAVRVDLEALIGRMASQEFVESQFQQLRMRTEALYNELEILQEAERARVARAKEREKAGEDALRAVQEVQQRVSTLSQNVEDDFTKLSAEMLTKADAGKLHDILVRLNDLAPVSKASVDRIRQQLTSKASKSDVDRLAGLAARLHDTVRELDQAHRHGMAAGPEESTATHQVPKCLTCNRAVPGGISKGSGALADSPSSSELVAAMHLRQKAEQHFQQMARQHQEQQQQQQQQFRSDLRHGSASQHSYDPEHYQSSERQYQRRPATASGSTTLLSDHGSGGSIYVMRASTISNSQYSKSLDARSKGTRLLPLQMVRRGGRPRSVKSAGPYGRKSNVSPHAHGRSHSRPASRQRSWGGSVRALTPDGSVIRAYGRGAPSGILLGGDGSGMSMSINTLAVGAEDSMIGSPIARPELLEAGGSMMGDGGGSAVLGASSSTIGRAEDSGMLMGGGSGTFRTAGEDDGLAGPFSPMKPMRTFVKGCDGKLYQSGMS
jgi:hypothetical protein